MQSLIFICPYCSGRLSADVTDIGHFVECPNCQKEFILKTELLTNGRLPSPGVIPPPTSPNRRISIVSVLLLLLILGLAVTLYYISTIPIVSQASRTQYPTDSASSPAAVSTEYPTNEQIPLTSEIPFDTIVKDDLPAEPSYEDLIRNQWVHVVYKTFTEADARAVHLVCSNQLMYSGAPYRAGVVHDALTNSYMIVVFGFRSHRDAEAQVGDVYRVLQNSIELSGPEDIVVDMPVRD